MMSNKQDLKAAATGQAQPAADPFKVAYDQLKSQFERTKTEFLPLFGNSETNVAAFIRVVLNAVTDNPDLLLADRRSLLTSAMKAAQDGLLPNGHEAVLNIYNTKLKDVGGREYWVKMVEYLPMVAGFVKMLYASGEVKTIDAAAVFENDRFRFVRGDEPKLEHEPTGVDVPGKVIAAYCTIKMMNGEMKREVMWRRDIEAVKSVSKATGANSPWAKWYDQQAIKSVIKRIYKQMPKSDRFDRIERSDNQVIGFAATPHSVADVAMRTGLAFNPSETIDMPPMRQTGEPVELERTYDDRPDDLQGAAAKSDASAAKAAAPAEASAASKPIEGQAGETYAQLTERLKKAKNRDAADLIIDAARHLPEDQMADLKKFADGKFPPA